jgi:hypothetical protein
VLFNSILLAGTESHRVDAVRVVEEVVGSGVNFNVLPAVSLPSAGDELHGAVSLLVGVRAIEVVAVETVVRGVEILGRYGVAVFWASFLVKLLVGLAVNRNLLHLLGVGLPGISNTSEFAASTRRFGFRDHLKGMGLESGREDLLLSFRLLGKHFVSGVVRSCLWHFFYR